MKSFLNKISYFGQRLFGGYKKILAKIGWLNSLILLSLVYFVFLPLMVVVFRLKKVKHSKAGWQARPKTHPNSYEHQF